MPSTSAHALATRVLHGDDAQFAAERAVHPVVAPIYWTATFAAEDAESFAAMSADPRHPAVYTRHGNPTHERVQRIMADLEGTEDALLTASGMGAISTSVLALVKKGDHVIAQTRHYMAAARLFADVLPSYGVEVSIVEQSELGNFEKEIKPNTVLIYIETPANPTIVLTDVAGIAALAKKHSTPNNRIVTIADNTFAGPVNTRPADLGIDVVVHSATKSLGGHHDLTAGVICTSRELGTKIHLMHTILGSVASPMDAWLLLRGIRTLTLRVDKINSNALALAEFLEQQPNVERVYYPLLKSHPQHELAQRQMKGGGPVIAFAVKGDYKATAEFVAQLKLIVHAVSLGGIDSLIVHTATMWKSTMSEAQMKEAGIAVNFVRFSVGVEDVDDLKADLTQALATVPS
ncbi:hypothetical protein Q8F55_004547 [Vanrija albida]|uniref:Methionine gamma-lyase n=1 Tax=Vanrija albida TaxID=181172 RepID=A0ABR3Q727_9TREE